MSRLACPTITVVLLLALSPLPWLAPIPAPSYPWFTAPAGRLAWPQGSPGSHREVSLRVHPFPGALDGQPPPTPGGEGPEPSVHLVPASSLATSARPALPGRPSLAATGLTPGFRF